MWLNHISNHVTCLPVPPYVLDINIYFAAWSIPIDNFFFIKVLIQFYFLYFCSFIFFFLLIISCIIENHLYYKIYIIASFVAVSLIFDESKKYKIKETMWSYIRLAVIDQKSGDLHIKKGTWEFFQKSFNCYEMIHLQNNFTEDKKRIYKSTCVFFKISQRRKYYFVTVKYWQYLVVSINYR